MLFPRLDAFRNKQNYLWLVLEVDRVPVALLQDAGVEVVLVLDVEVPAADVGVGHVVAAQFGGLRQMLLNFFLRPRRYRKIG